MDQSRLVSMPVKSHSRSMLMAFTMTQTVEINLRTLIIKYWPLVMVLFMVNAIGWSKTHGQRIGATMVMY